MKKLGRKGWGIIAATVGILGLVGGIGSSDPIENPWVYFPFCLLLIAVGLLLVFYRQVLKKTAVGNTRALKEEIFYAAGEYYYRANIQKLATANPEWNESCSAIIKRGKADRPIYRYNFTNKPVQLIPENNNAHDKNAVKIQIAGKKVGYISAVDALHVRSILSDHEVKYISAFVGGGEYKIVSADGTSEQLEKDLNITVKIGYV